MNRQIRFLTVFPCIVCAFMLTCCLGCTGLQPVVDSVAGLINRARGESTVHIDNIVTPPANDVAVTNSNSSAGSDPIQ